MYQKIFLGMRNLHLKKIDLFVFHQASKLVIENLIRSMSLDKNKVFTNFENIGNTVSSTIPIALKDADTQGRLKDGGYCNAHWVWRWIILGRNTATVV